MATKQLDGKVAIIIGAGRGIGAATDQLFAQEGARVVLAWRHAEELARLYVTGVTLPVDGGFIVR